MTWRVYLEETVFRGKISVDHETAQSPPWGTPLHLVGYPQRKQLNDYSRILHNRRN